MAFSAFQIVKELYEPLGGKGVFKAQERKNPDSAFYAPTGVLVDPREVPGCSGNLPEMSCGGYVMPFPFQFSGR